MATPSSDGPPGGFADPYLGYPGGNPFPALNTGWATQPFPAFGVYVNAPLDLKPTTLQQWNVTVQHQFGDWLASAGYLGNHSSHLWRATELNPAVTSPASSLNPRRRVSASSRLNDEYDVGPRSVRVTNDDGAGNRARTCSLGSAASIARPVAVS